MIADGIAGS